MSDLRPFCICLHSPWSHRVAYWNALHQIDEVNGKLHEACERTGCRCLDYTPKGVE